MKDFLIGLFIGAFITIWLICYVSQAILYSDDIKMGQFMSKSGHLYSIKLVK